MTAPLTLQYMQRVLLVGRAAEVRKTFTARAVNVECVDEIQADDGAFYDCIAFADFPQGEHLITARTRLHPNGAVYFLRALPPACGGTEGGIEAAGLRLYLTWNWQVDRGVTMAVHQGYDPVHHARDLFRQGHPGMSLEVLMNVPDDFYPDPHDRARLASEKQLCYLAWDQTAHPDERLNRFFREQREFYKAVTLDPHHHPAYVWHAEFWRRIGDEGMAARLLRSIDHIAPSETVRSQLSTLDPVRIERAEDAPPEWTGEFCPRVLIVCHEHSDYGLDTLYDGLVQLLGIDHVVEFPWKPTLHGQSPEMAHGYPCTFNHAGEPRPLEWVCAQLQEKAFDLVFYADTLLELDANMVRRILEAAGDTPLFIVDTWDDGGDYLQDTLDHIGRTSAHAYFKREMLQCAQYPPRTYPLPFSYPMDRVPQTLSAPRTLPLFWAGKRQDGLRRLYLEHLESRLGVDLKVRYVQEEYARVLEMALIGLNLFGLGFDTVRYWELPAHGCLLLSERPPIRIPHNFIDGESAVFFDDATELDEKLDYYLAHPQEAQAIAAAGRARFLKYHTSGARAEQMLGRIEQVLRGVYG